MPTPDTARVYPGGCLVEGTNLSEGRGTTRPFEIVGAPWLDGRALAATLEREGLEGARFRPTGFRPTFQKHAGRSCGGVQVHVTDPRGLPSVRDLPGAPARGPGAGPLLVRLAPGAIRVRLGPPRHRPPPGRRDLRRAIESGVTVARWSRIWRDDLERFAPTRERFLLVRDWSRA